MCIQLTFRLPVLSARATICPWLSILPTSPFLFFVGSQLPANDCTQRIPVSSVCSHLPNISHRQPSSVRHTATRMLSEMNHAGAFAGFDTHPARIRTRSSSRTPPDKVKGTISAAHTGHNECWQRAASNRPLVTAASCYNQQYIPGILSDHTGVLRKAMLSCAMKCLSGVTASTTVSIPSTRTGTKYRSPATMADDSALSTASFFA